MTPLTQSEAEALLPCPFCGEEPELRNADDEIMREVTCSNCDLTIMESACPEGAVARWNTRATLPSQDSSGDARELVERLRTFARMLFHADAIAIQPKAPNQVETTQITTTESRLLQKCLSDAEAALSRQDRPEGVGKDVSLGASHLRLMERVAAVVFADREGAADYHRACEDIARECGPLFEQLGMVLDHDGWGFVDDQPSALGSQHRPAPVDEAAVERASRAAFPNEWDSIDRRRLAAKCYRETPHEQAGFESRESADALAAEYEAAADRSAEWACGVIRRALTASPPSSDGLTIPDAREGIVDAAVRAAKTISIPDDDGSGTTRLFVRIDHMAEAIRQALSDEEPRR